MIKYMQWCGCCLKYNRYMWTAPLHIRGPREARGAALQRLLVAGPALGRRAPHPPPRHAVQSLYNSPRLPRP